MNIQICWYKHRSKILYLMTNIYIVLFLLYNNVIDYL